MALRHISNGNTAFGVRNSVELGTWGSASFNAMLLAGTDRVELDVRVHGHYAKFTKKQIEAIAEHLHEFAALMPDHD